MQALSEILRAHAAKYPAMEVTDAVKLIYQNEFGGGHMITNSDACLAYLRREYAMTPKETDRELLEQIGNGIVRVHLAALPEDRLENLGSAFIRSANAHKGNLESFLEKLALLRRLTGEGMFSFDLAALDAYLAVYAAAGYPAVSHSDAYRMAYKPAYRIVKREEFI